MRGPLEGKTGSAGYYYMEGSMTWDGSVIERGYYVPIDYELVGGTSRAIKRSWKLEYLYTPEKIYGRIM
ncbi:hypothetical protein ES703_13633 [subsurface metagenome]